MEAGATGEARMGRFDLSDEEWELVVPHIPRTTGRGGRMRDARRVLNGMFHVLRSGTIWRDLPERYGPWQTVYYWFNRWRRDGTLRKMADALQNRLHGWGRIDRDLWLVDSTNVRAHRSAAGARKKTARERSMIRH
jgi:transposase